MSLGEIQQHLREAHNEVQSSIEMIKGALDDHMNKAHTSVGAAMAAGMTGSEIDEIAGYLTQIDSDGTQLVEKMSATMSMISELGSL